MLQLRPVCENCGKNLPNEASDAMICTFECTYCAECAINLFNNVCPNCGGGFEKRPTRPTECVTHQCIANFPAETNLKLRPVNLLNFEWLKKHYENVDPRNR
jgi:hypothetical protein